MENLERKNNNKDEHLIITNIELYLPDDVLTNKDLEEQFGKYSSNDTSDKDKIFDLVGIKERRTVNDKMVATDMAVEATKKLLNTTPVNKDEKTLYVVGTVTNEDRYPSVAAKMMEKLELTYAHGHHFESNGYDLGAACSGWTYGVEDVAARLLAGGYFTEGIPYEKGVVITSDTSTRILKRYDADTRILFGDAATATMIQRENKETKGFRILRTSNSTIARGEDTKDVSMPTELSLSHNKGEDINTMVMNGKKVYIHGREYTSNFFHAYCEAYNINPDSIDYFIPHQSNKRMLDSMDRDFLKLGKNKYGEDKMLSNIENVGNTVASSTPLCLFDFWKEGKFKNGDRIVLCSFGAGYTLGIVDVEVKM